jgi:phosphonate transport system permease protein
VTRPAPWRHRTRARDLAVWSLWLAGVALLLACWRFVSEHTTWPFVADAPRVAADILERMLPPDWSLPGSLWPALRDTLNIATLGTALAVLLATPLAFAAARNTTPAPLLRPIALLLIVSSRSINSLIGGLVLVTVLGPGVLAGILALALRSVGFIAKLLYEAIEEIDPRPVEAITATGAGSGQRLVYGVWPQVLPAFVGICVFRWDINVRESTVLGLVGAGGIGMHLQAAVNSVAWQQVSALLLVILAAVIGSEALSARLRSLTI